jgi:hypothetical protein
MSDKTKHGSDNLVMKMQRIRHIKPEFFQHEGLFDAEEKSGLPIRLALAGLWTVCDKNGRFEWKPRQLKVKILPYDQLDFAKVLDALAEGDFIRPYDVDGQRYGYIPTWRKHQAISMSEAKTKFSYPAPEGAGEEETVSYPVGEEQCENVPVSESVSVKENVSVSKNVNANGSEKAQSHSQSHSAQPEAAISSTSFTNSNSSSNSNSNSKPEPRKRGQMFSDDELGELFTPEQRATGRRLAELFYSVLKPENQAEATPALRDLWHWDFAKLNKDYPAEEIEEVIRALPRLKLAKYVVRAQTFVEKWDELQKTARKAKGTKCESCGAPATHKANGHLVCASCLEEYRKGRVSL